MGELGLRSAVRTSTAAYWSSWADTLSMIRARHPAVTDDMVITFSANPKGQHLQRANNCRRRLQDAGFDAPEWGDLSRGLRPGQRGVDEAPEPVAPRHGWQRVAVQEVDASFFEGVVWPRLTPSARGFVTFTRWTHPGSSLAAPLVPTSFVHCKLPVWPSTRFAWLSPCSPWLRSWVTEVLPRGASSSLPQ